MNHKCNQKQDIYKISHNIQSIDTSETRQFLLCSDYYKLLPTKSCLKDDNELGKIFFTMGVQKTPSIYCIPQQHTFQKWVGSTDIYENQL